MILVLVSRTCFKQISGLFVMYMSVKMQLASTDPMIEAKCSGEFIPWIVIQERSATPKYASALAKCIDIW